MNNLTGLLALAVALTPMMSCATNPATGRTQLILIGEDKEIQIGRDAVPEVKEEFGVYPDAALGDFLGATGRELAALTERPGLPYQFTLVDSPVVNAFALPGGPVFATRGLLAHANDQAELAGVVGHEIGHVVARHGAERISQSQLFSVTLGVLGALRPGVRRYSDLLGSGAQLILLGNSRAAEREADKLGVRYLARAGYDPLGMARFMGVLDRLDRDRERALPAWLSTHPDPGNREEATRQQALPLLERMRKKQKVPRTLGPEYLTRLKGLVFGDDPRQGFTRGTIFHHPGMAFRFEFPEGWKLENTQRLVAVTEAGDQPRAQFILRLVSPQRSQGLTPQAYAERVEREEPGLKLQGQAMTQHGLAAWRGRAKVTQQDGSSFPLLVAWVAHRDRLFELVGAYDSRAGEELPGKLDRMIASLREEKEAAILGVKPVVLEMAQAKAGATLNEICAARKDLGAPCKDVARINQLGLQAPLPAGRTLKIPVRQSPLYP